MEKLFILKEGANPNYLATICKIEETMPIVGADRLVKTVINGYDIVISKDFNVGDIVVYFPVETCICEKFLSANNLYEYSEAERNSNFKEVEELVTKVENASTEEEGKKYYDLAKSKCGFFNKYGRVRILKLRGQYSQGFIAKVDSLVKYNSDLVNVNWESLIGKQFNYIGDEEFCWKYIPVIKVNSHHGRSDNHQWKKRTKKLAKFDRLIPEQFAYHYDTKMLQEHFKEFSPDDDVIISVKCHGTSGIFSNILCNRKLSRWEKIKKFFGFKVLETEYGNVYSSRSVIKNRYINPNVGSFYDVDVWGAVNEVISPHIEEGFTIYGEIVGYLPGANKFIQKNHDYGCNPGEWKFMPYRITHTDEFGNKTELDVEEVYEWTINLINENKELANKIMPITILYNGKFKDLYPDVEINDNWHKNVLERMKNDKTTFLMEEKEPMCKNKVPREGIVIRKNGDMFARAWKLKTKAHYSLECKANDNGEVDIEEQESNAWSEYLKNNVVLATDGHGMPTAAIPRKIYEQMTKK